MRFAKYWTGVVVVASITVPLLTAGCTRDHAVTGARDDSSQHTSADIAQLPEVVVTGRRPGGETIAMSDRNATGISVSRGRHP